MDRFGAGLAADHPGATGGRCVLFGCLEAAVWIVSDPQGGELADCEVDVDVILSDALGRVPLDGDIRIEVRRAPGGWLRLAAADGAGSARREGRAAIPGAMDSWPTLVVPGDRARPRAGESVPGAFGVAGGAGPRTAG